MLKTLMRTQLFYSLGSLIVERSRTLIYEKTSPSPMKELSRVMSLSIRNRFPFLFLRLSQASVRQFLFQRTQVAVLLAQGCHVARPRLTLTKLLIQGAHLCEECAGLLIVLAIALGD